MNTILRIGREMTESISSPEGTWGAGREFINGFMEKVVFELSFDECN